LLFLILLDQSISPSAAININGLINKYAQILKGPPRIQIPANRLMKLKRPLLTVQELMGKCKDGPPQGICPKLKNAYQQNCPNAAYEALCPIVKVVYQWCCRNDA
ncbi:hypothetical protein P7M48_23985, partial [Vibrio parahaemolyticus]|nr:hypothetical protein [Vibrio parahaemolyticus]